MSTNPNLRACVAGRMGDDGDRLTDDEYEEIIGTYEGRRNQGERLEDILESVGRMHMEQRALEKRAAILMAIKRKEILSRISFFAEGKSSAKQFTGVLDFWKKNKHGAPLGDQMQGIGGKLKAAGYEALLASSNQKSVYARESVDARRRGWATKLVSGFVRDIYVTGTQGEFLGLRRFGVNYGDARNELNVAREMYEMSMRDGHPGITGDQQAIKAAQVAVKHLRMARIDQNLTGAWIKDLPGFIASSTHSPRKLQKAGFEAWKNFVLGRNSDGKIRLDVRRTFYDPDKPPPTPAEIEVKLRSIYNDLASGSIAHELPVGNVSIKGGQNLARRASEHRTLHWDGPLAFVEYNREFGHGNLFDAIIATLDRAAHVGSLMEIMGPNPEFMHEWIKAKGIEANRGDAKEILAWKSNRIDGLFDAAVGKLDSIGNLTFAHLGSSIRAWQRITMLGGSVIASIGDPLIQASRLEANGMNFGEMAWDQLKSIVTNSKQSREVASALAFGYDTMMRDIVAKFDGGEDVAGWLGKAQHHAFWFFGNNFWESTRERAFVHALSAFHYSNRALPFMALPEDTRVNFLTHGIGEREWNVIRRRGAVDLHDGLGAIDPQTLRRNLTDQDIRDMAGNKFLNQSAIDRERLRIESLWQSYLADEVGMATLKPGVREKAYQSGYNGKNIRGTQVGELLRAMFLFKGYPSQYLQRVIGSFVEEDKMHLAAGRALTSWNPRLAKLVGGLMVIGVATVYLKDLLKNKTPRDPTDPRMLMAGFMQSGGAGIYGDFLFSLQDRHGNHPLLTLAGPTASDIESLLEIGSKTAFGAYDAITNDDWVRLKQAGDKAFWFAKQNTPYVNVWYGRAAMDYLIWHNMAEALNPGAMARERQRMLDETGQDFLVEPMALQ